MKQFIQKNSTAVFLILIGVAYLMGAIFNSGQGWRGGSERIVIQDVAEDIRIRPEVRVYEEIAIPPLPTVPPFAAVPPVLPERPFPVYHQYEPLLTMGWLIRTLIQNLIPALLILVGIWILVRQRQATATPVEKPPSSVAE